MRNEDVHYNYNRRYNHNITSLIHPPTYNEYCKNLVLGYCLHSDATENETLRGRRIHAKIG